MSSPSSWSLVFENPTGLHEPNTPDNLGFLPTAPIIVIFNSAKHLALFKSTVPHNPMSPRIQKRSKEVSDQEWRLPSWSFQAPDEWRECSVESNHWERCRWGVPIEVGEGVSELWKVCRRSPTLVQSLTAIERQQEWRANFTRRSTAPCLRCWPPRNLLWRCGPRSEPISSLSD